jgi:hypothetical protein
MKFVDPTAPHRKSGAGDYRRAYIEALRAADLNDIQLLLHFART